MSTILYRNGSTEIKDGCPIVVDEAVKLHMEVVVRLIKDTGIRKECIAEEVFETRPSATQIIWCLLRHSEATFAVVEDKYTLNNDLPFA